MSKSWPKNNQPVDFEALTKPIVDAIEFCYELKRTNEDKDCPYDGYEHTQLHICFPAEEQLSVKMLAEEDQGRSPLDVIIGLAIQLGIEQGKRLEKKEREPDDEFKKEIIEIYKKRIKELQNLLTN